VAVVQVLADSSPWTGIIVAALGSSALGAIVGGYMTTRMQGLQEREEAWRTRLIEASHEVTGLLTQCLSALYAIFGQISRGELSLRDASAAPSKEAAAAAATCWDLQRQATLANAQLDLLVSDKKTDLTQVSYGVLYSIRLAISFLELNPLAEQFAKVVLAEREATGAGLIHYLALNVEAEVVFDFLMKSRWPIPPRFEAGDDKNVVESATTMNEVANARHDTFIEAAHDYIENYRLPTRRPLRRG
jgi:hypothetical protein